ncbi:hypothetical protein KAH27_07785 [bacterium]|nr:hypothetical protein [bacterium]
MNLSVINLSSVAFFCLLNQAFAWELITQDDAPYTYEEANWRVGNYMQALFYNYSNLPALSENFIGRGKLPTERFPDLYYIGNTGLDLLSFSEEAIYTPVVRLELIKKIFKAMYNSHYKNADALWLVYSGTKRQVSFLSSTHISGPGFRPVFEYPESKLIARNLPDTAPEKLALVWPRVKVNDKWHDDSDMEFEDIKNNVSDKLEQSFITERLYTSDEVGRVKIKGIGWAGQQDKVLELTLSMPADKNRQSAQLVFSNLTDKKMGFSAPYPTELPETIQLPDGKEISSKFFSVEKPDYNYIIIYTKDADKSGFEYQNAMMFGWRETPSKVTVHWSDDSESSRHKAYPGTEGKTDVIAGVHGGGYYRVDFEYDDKTNFHKSVWMERFQGIDPSLSLSHLHHIASNICSTGHVGMPGYLSTESSWLEEPVCAFPAAAYVLAMFDEQEDKFGGDFSQEAVNIATKIVDDRIAMWKRGRKSSNFHEYVSGAYYLSLLYKMPGRFNNPQKRNYYKKWMKIWADELVKEKNSKYCSARHMIALWRAYELSHSSKYKKAFEKSRSVFKISEKNGLYINDKWISPREFYSYGDLMGALGRRGTSKDAKDIQKLITYLTNQKRWTDTGYMGKWWEVTIENHNFFGRWCKALDMADTPKRIVSVSEFPIYYKKNGKVIGRMSDIPPFYNPDYFDKSVMEKYLPVLPQKIASSVIFRIDNILLKKDYANNWWIGTDNPEAIESLKKIKKNILKIKREIETKGKKFVCDENIEKLLAETDSLFRKTAEIFGEETVRNGSQPAGNATNLKGELHVCRGNFRYLQNIIRKQK